MSEFTVTLPSRGLLYGGKIPGGKYDLRALTFTEQSILYNPGSDAVRKFDQILNNCSVTKTVPVTDLLMTDRMYLMIALRSKAFGSEYKIPLRCSSCAIQYNFSLDLARDLTMKVYEDPATYKGEDSTAIPMGAGFVEPFSVILPNSNSTIEYRLLRGKDESTIALQAKRILMQSSDSSDPSLAIRFSLMIKTIDGNELPTEAKMAYIQSMDAGDVERFNQDIEEKESGLNLSFTTTCRSCGFIEEVGLPFTAEFFRPRRSR